MPISLQGRRTFPPGPVNRIDVKNVPGKIKNVKKRKKRGKNIKKRFKNVE